MKELFHKFQSRQFQFALELMAQLRAAREIPMAQVEQIARSCGLEYADQCLPWLLEAGLLEKTPGGICLPDNTAPVLLPPGTLEMEYLAHILGMPEAALFLSPQTREALAVPSGEPDPAVQIIGSRQVMPPPELSAEEFSVLLDCIRRRRWLHYSYRTAASSAYRPAATVPWKLEYDAFDRRWWLIHYDPVQNRTIKSVLSNLRQFRAGTGADVTEEQILTALERLLAPEPIELLIQPQKNALERCAMTFERQMLRTIRRREDGNYLLSFRWYAFDESEILQKLLYLGPAVRLLSPVSLRKKLLALLDEALQIQNGPYGDG
jgi:predicted DNA-binding transcriptional regulator YafY